MRVTLKNWEGLGTRLAEACVATFHVDCRIQEAVEQLQRDFRQQVYRIHSSFIETVPVTALLDLLKQLPAGLGSKGSNWLSLK